jgi:protein-disulfide isomerase
MGRMAPKVQKDLNDGLQYGITGTPTFFINGIELVGAQPYTVFEQVISDELYNNSIS